MNNNKRGELRISNTKKVLLLVLLLVGVFPLQLLAQNRNEKKSSEGIVSMLFYYQPNARVLLKDYRSNHSGDNLLWSTIRNHSRELRAGRSHLQITVYVNTEDLINKRVVNTASIHGNILRSLIKQKALLNCAHCTFYFDTAQVMMDRACVKYIPMPVKVRSNQSVYYTLHMNNRAYMNAAYNHYFRTFGKLPILGDECGADTIYAAGAIGANDERVVADTQVVRHITDSIVVRHVVDTVIYHRAPKVLYKKTTVQPVQKNSAQKDTVRTVQEEPVKVQLAPPCAEQKVEKVKKIKKKRPDFYPLIGIKTNLIYWAGYTSEFKRRGTIPNLEAELYLQPHYSIDVDFTYNYLNKGKMRPEHKTWGISNVGLEPRYWFGRAGKFTGFYAGVYGLYGQFDLKTKDQLANGYTGNFYEGGASLGYSLQFTSHLGLEIGARYGYRVADGNTYEYMNSDYYRTNSFNQKGMKLTGIRFMLTYRFGKTQKNK
jgi:hypothetical protein